MRTFLGKAAWVAVFLLVALAIWTFQYSLKPKVYAKVLTGETTLAVTNGNDEEWPSARIILNDALSGNFLVASKWPPGEKREFKLSEFKGTLNNQAFNPEFEKLKEVTVDVPGYKLSIYVVR